MFALLSDASILAQRFLESEGELGRHFTRVLSKLGELQQTLGAPPTPALPAAADVHQSLQRELAMFDYALSHTRLIQENAIQEMSNYQHMEANTIGQIHSTVASLVGLQAELEEAKQWRREQEEYELMHKQLAGLPARSVTQSEVERLEVCQRGREVERAGLLEDLEAKRRNHLLLAVAFEQLRAEWSAAERAASAATQISRAQAEAEAEAERRRAEEDALAYAAAAEAKASATQALQAEEGEEGEEKPSKARSAPGGQGAPGGEDEEPEEGEEEAGGGGSTPMETTATNTAASTADKAPTPTPSRAVSEESVNAATPTPADSPAASPTPAAEDAPTPMET